MHMSSGTGMNATKPPTRKRNAKTPTKARKARVAPGAKETAEKAAGMAKATGAIGRKITLAQRQLRDSAIMARAAAGWSQTMIADEFEITARQVRRVLSERPRLPSGLDDPPMQLVEELLRGYRSSIADFEAMAYRYSEAHPNVALGAKRAAGDALDRYANMLALVGKLPSDISLVRSEGVLRQLADEMVDAVMRVEAGELAPADAAVLFRRLVAVDG